MRTDMEPLGNRRISFAWTAAAWVALVAVLAGGALVVLHRWHNQAAHQAAAQAVAERGHGWR
jgi:hypothetical protein